MRDDPRVIADRRRCLLELPPHVDARLVVEEQHGVALGGARAALYVEIQNITNRENAEEIIYSADFSQQGYLTSLPLLAIAGVRLEP